MADVKLFFMADLLETILEKHPNPRRGDLITLLQEAQEANGYLTEEAIVRISKYLGLPTSKTFGIATFYNQFSFEPKGKFHIRVCHGTSCHIAGATKLIKELEKLLRTRHGETTRDGLFSIEIVSCMGACSHAPVMAINDEPYIHLTIEEVRHIVDDLKKQEQGDV